MIYIIFECFHWVSSIASAFLPSYWFFLLLTSIHLLEFLWSILSIYSHDKMSFNVNRFYYPSLFKHPLWIHYVYPTWQQLTRIAYSYSQYIYSSCNNDYIILTLENDAHPSPPPLVPGLPFVFVVLINATSLLFASRRLLFTLLMPVVRRWRHRNLWWNRNL